MEVVVEVEEVDMANSEAGHGTVTNFAQLLSSNKMFLSSISEKIIYVKLLFISKVLELVGRLRIMFVFFGL